MGIRKLSRTAGTRKEMSAEEWKQILNSMETFGMKPLSSDQLQQLQYKENCYPVIPVPNKFLLLAVHSTRFTGLVWLSNWFLVDSTYRDKYNEYHVRLSVNGSLVDVDYDLLYPKEVTKISKYGLIFNFDHADAFSRYLFCCITKLEIEEQYCGMGFMMKEKKLQFIAYEEGAKILQYTKDVPLEVYTEGLNRLLTNTAVMFALCCSCASLFLAYLGIQCGMALQSFIISFYGRTTTGKSTAQALMASVFTNPNDKKIYVPFFGTLNAIVRNFAQKFGIPQIFDEATVSSGVNMENLFYTVTLEQDKSRCNTNADLRESDTWKLIMITSSECRLLHSRKNITIGDKKAHRYEDSFAVYVLGHSDFNGVLDSPARYALRSCLSAFDKVRYLSNKVRSSAEIASALNTGVLIFSKNSDMVI